MTVICKLYVLLNRRFKMMPLLNDITRKRMICNFSNPHIEHKMICGTFYNKSNFIRFVSNKGDDEFEKTENKSKTKLLPKITLLDTEENMTVTTLQEANKIAERRNLKLVKIVDLDSKFQRPIYRLMSGAQYLDEEIKARKTVKEEKAQGKSGEKVIKLLMISCHIGKGDLGSKISKIHKWIDKNYDVRVIISGNEQQQSLSQDVFKEVEDNTKEISKISQKIVKGGDIRFQMNPLKGAKEKKKSKKQSTDVISPEEEELNR